MKGTEYFVSLLTSVVPAEGLWYYS